MFRVLIALVSLLMPFWTSANAHEAKCSSSLGETMIAFTAFQRVELEGLKDILAAQLEAKIKEERPKALALLPGKSFRINGKAYDRGAILGAGNEGLVVTAESGGRRFAVKFFFEVSDLKGNVAELRALKGKLLTPTIHEVDVKSKAVVFELIEGVSFRDLNSNWREVSDTLLAKVREAVTSEFSGETIRMYNSVIEIESGRIYLVDPR